MAHAGIRKAAQVVVAALILSGAARAAPQGIPISGTPVCRVSLDKVSYDGPGADDEEVVELSVEPFAAPVPSGPAPSADAGAPAPMPTCNTSHGAPDASAPFAEAGPRVDASDAANRRLTLADCGLSELRLVNGGSGACDEYRTIPLGAVALPADGYVLVCAQDSTFAGLCDVNTAGRSAIKNGFLQNGPNDGLRFVDVSGAVALEVGYEGGPACFSAAAPELVDETGDAPSTPGEDDVNVACAGRFELRSAAEAPLRRANRCNSEVPDGGGNAALRATGTVDSGAPRAGAAEFAPDATAFPSFFSVPDGGITVTSRLQRAPVEPPSCRAVPACANTPAAIPAVAAASLLAMLRRRKQRVPASVRAGCFARSGIRRRRSPSH